jgi:hypothetical protein
MRQEDRPGWPELVNWRSDLCQMFFGHLSKGLVVLLRAFFVFIVAIFFEGWSGLEG